MCFFFWGGSDVQQNWVMLVFLLFFLSSLGTFCLKQWVLVEVENR